MYHSSSPSEVHRLTIYLDKISVLKSIEKGWIKRVTIFLKSRTNNSEEINLRSLKFASILP